MTEKLKSIVNRHREGEALATIERSFVAPLTTGGNNMQMAWEGYAEAEQYDTTFDKSLQIPWEEGEESNNE